MGTIKNREEQSPHRANWQPSPRALPEQAEDSEYTVSVSPNPAAISIPTLEASRKLEEHTDRQIVFLIMRENAPKNASGFSPFMVERICDHRADLPRRALILLHTRGGCPVGAFKLGRFLQQACETHDVVIPRMAMSAGTLFSLAGDRIFLSPEAHCGPCDMQIDGRSSLSIMRDEDYVHGVLAGIAQAIRAHDHDKQRPFAETAELLSHVQAATKVPKLAGEWSEAKEGMLSVINYVVELLRAKNYTHEEAEAIAYKLCTEYHDHKHPIYFDELQSIGIRNVHCRNSETFRFRKAGRAFSPRPEEVPPRGGGDPGPYFR